MDKVRRALLFARTMRAIRVLFAACVLAIATLAPAAAQNWYFPHFSGGNTSFYSGIMTAPAGAGSVSVPNIGTFANGAGPVIDMNGTLYIGNEQGRLMAFSETGMPVWNVGLSGGERIVSSAMVWNSDIYVVGTSDTSAALYRFRADGTQVYRAPFPRHRDGMIMTTAPNISQIGPNPVVVLPVAYKAANVQVYETRLLLFLDTGALYLDTPIDTIVPQASGSFGGASIAPGAPDIAKPLPMAAVGTDYKVSPPVQYIAVADGFQTLVLYRTTATGVSEAGRWKQTDRMRSFDVTPNLDFSFAPGGHRGVVRTFSSRGYLLGGLAGEELNRIGEFFGDSSPTMVRDRILSAAGDKFSFTGSQGLQHMQLPGRSIVPPASSQNYTYVSSEDALTTWQLTNSGYVQVARFDWVGGGRNPPIIGTNGRVYAIASNILFIFPPPPKPPEYAILPTQPYAVQGETSNAAPQAPPPTQPASQLYKPPLTANGNRLFACEELDQDDCGKGDHRAISLAWCQAQGYAKVSGFDVDSRKVRAETLNGQFCSKNKCKVFDSIGCEN